jgi:hypothetical protein
MADLRHLAVHEIRRPYDIAPEGETDRLMAKTDAEYRYSIPEFLDGLNRNAGLTGRARTRRDHDPIGVPVGDFPDRNHVVAEYGDLSFVELAEILDQVIRE